MAWAAGSSQGLSRCLADGSLLPMSSPGLSSVRVFVQISPFYKHTTQIRAHSNDLILM